MLFTSLIRRLPGYKRNSAVKADSVIISNYHLQERRQDKYDEFQAYFIINVFGKVFDKAMHGSLSHHLHTNNILIIE